MNPYLNKVIQVIDDHIASIKPQMKWMWGEALFGYALLKLDEYLNDTKYKSFIESYLNYYLAHPPKVDQSDTFAPILISHTYDQIYQCHTYQSLTQRGLDYFLNTKPVIDFLPNHLGHSLVGKFYQKSIWVDSIMMYGVFLSVYGKDTKQETYTNLSYETVMKFQDYLEHDGLWTHAYLTRKRKAYPKGIYWGRGNGWVVTALPMIYKNLNQKQQQDILPIFQRTCQSIMKYQKKGLYQTILNFPSIFESSASLLIHGGVLEGANLGLVSEEVCQLAKDGYEKTLDTFIHVKKGHLVLTRVSNPTIPMPVFPKLGYKCIGVKDNWSYGLASLIFASIAYDSYVKQKK